MRFPVPARLFWDPTHPQPSRGPAHPPNPVWTSPLQLPIRSCLPQDCCSAQAGSLRDSLKPHPLRDVTRDPGLPKPLLLLDGPHSQPEGGNGPCTAPGLGREASPRRLLGGGWALAPSPPRQTPAKANPPARRRPSRARETGQRGCTRSRTQRSRGQSWRLASVTHSRGSKEEPRKRRENVVSKGP